MNDEMGVGGGWGGVHIVGVADEGNWLFGLGEHECSKQNISKCNIINSLKYYI